MGFVVYHMEKAAGNDSGTTAHIERSVMPKNADPTRTYLNRQLIEYPEGVKDRTAAIQYRLDNAGLTRKIGSNQVQAIRILLSATPEDMARIDREGKLGEWYGDSLQYLYDTFGKENIVSALLHMDEKTPHIHATLVPIVKGERKRRKREEQVKKRYRKKPTDTVRLSADDIMTRQKLKSYQDGYAMAMQGYGLQRGINGSEARHISNQQYYREMQLLADELRADVQELQEQKETAKDELKRMKREAKAEKLKGAFATTATNFTESVGSLFGGNNKVKNENEQLKLRIEELQREAENRERHIEQMNRQRAQEEKRHSEYVAKIQRYFPFIESLMPMVNFLKNTLRFSDEIIRKLCTFKPIVLKGKFYSNEFNQEYEAERDEFRITKEVDKKYELKIDGVSHVEWFRMKRNEWRETMGIPKPRQNKGFRL